MNIFVLMAVCPDNPILTAYTAENKELSRLSNNAWSTNKLIGLFSSRSDAVIFNDRYLKLKLKDVEGYNVTKDGQPKDSPHFLEGSYSYIIERELDRLTQLC